MSFRVGFFLDLKGQELITKFCEGKMKINYQYGVVVQFPEKRGVLGEMDSSKAWTTQKFEQSAWFWLLLSLLHLTLEVIGKKGRM